MGILAMLVMGAIVGWIGARIVGRDEGLLASIVIGIVGAFIGSFVARFFGSGTASYMTFTWAGFLWSVLGAVLLSALLNATQHRSNRI